MFILCYLLQGWNKGVVFVNGANLGRYWMKGPTGSLYVPAPLLIRGVNKVTILTIELHLLFAGVCMMCRYYMYSEVIGSQKLGLGL